MDWFEKNHCMPGISIDSSNVYIIDSPEMFYKTIIEKIEKSERRISISSLYLGDGHLEKELVSALENRLASREELKITVLLDFLRGTRGAGEEKSSTTLLKTISDNAKIFLYHTPELSGFVKSLLPERTNEIIGLQHMKLYIFDDSLLISGANLSDSYFTNRQDRYILFENCNEIANFFNNIIEAVGDCSFQLKPDGSVELTPNCEVHPFLGDRNQYKEMMKMRINKAINEFQQYKYGSGNTIVYPIIQMGNLGIHQEYDLLKKLFSEKDEALKITMASGYFNSIEEYEDLIFGEGNYQIDILTASPLANGFYGAKGFSKFIPSLYSNVASQFLAKRHMSNRDSVKMFEYARQGWTFHAKGLWVDRHSSVATIVGSSNYGYRSVHRDLEAQVAIVTKEEDLMKRLREEKCRLFEYSSILDSVALHKPHHHVPTIVRVISRFIRNFF